MGIDSDTRQRAWRRMKAGIPTVLLTQTVGAGKTSVAEEISTLLQEAKVSHACLDLDWLCQLYPAPDDDPHNQALMFANLAAVRQNFRRRAPTYLVLARVLESRAELRRYQKAILEAAITVPSNTGYDSGRSARSSTHSGSAAGSLANP